MAKTDYYEVLGVEKKASEGDIKKAYRKLTMKHHPDKGGDDKKFHEIQEAYEVLSNKQKRQEYDQFGFAGPQQQGGFRYSSGNPFDIFGGMGGFDDFFKRTNQRPQRQVSDPIQLGLNLEFMDSIKGTKVKFNFNRKIKCSGCSGTGRDQDSEIEICITCGGSGQIRRSSGFFSVATTCPTCRGQGEIIKKPCKKCGGAGFEAEKKTIELKIPEGIENGQMIRIPNEGNRDKEQPGSLVIKVQVNPHKYFTRIQNHINIHMPITITQALLGTELNVPTIHGEKVKIKIPRLTKDGTQFVVKNQGIKKEGHMRVIIHIQLLNKLSDEEKEILEQLENRLESSKEPTPISLKEL